MASERFAYVGNVYFEALGISGLDTFLYQKPPEGGVIRWHAYRKIYLSFVFVFYPLFIIIQIWGIATADGNSLKQISFDISLLGYNVQNVFKLGIWIMSIRTVRSLCMDFSKFHINKYRPNLSSWMLEKESKATLKFAGRCYWISYLNLLFWVVLPTTTAVISYMIYLAGYADPQPTYIPRYSPTRFPFDMSVLSSRLLVAVMEAGILTFGFVSFQPIDMFFAAIIRMTQAQFHVLNSAFFAMDVELQEFWGTEIPVTDTEQPMAISLIVEDHQQMIRHGVLLRKFLNPILGLETFNCVTIICNMTIVAASQFSEEGKFLDLALEAFSSILVVITCLVVFNTYTSMAGVLKDAEESIFYAMYGSKWYERDVRHRKTIILMRKQAMTARRIKMFGLGDMERSTFIDGLRTVYSYYNFMQRFK